MTDKKKIVMVAAVFYPEPIVSANLLTQLAIELAKRYEVTVLRPYPTRPKGFKFAKYDYKRLPLKCWKLIHLHVRSRRLLEDIGKRIAWVEFVLSI